MDSDRRELQTATLILITVPAYGGVIYDVNLGGQNGAASRAASLLATVTGRDKADFGLGTPTTNIISEVIVQPPAGAPTSEAALVDAPTTANVANSLAASIGIPAASITVAVAAVTPPQPPPPPPSR